MSSQSRRCLFHLHQGNDSLLHPGSSRTCKNNDRDSLISCSLDGPCDLFTNDLAHAAHHKISAHDCNGRFTAPNLSFSRDHRFFQIGHRFLVLQLFQIARKLQRIGRGKSGVPLLKGIAVQDHGDPCSRPYSEIISTVGTDIIIFNNVFVIDRLSAVTAFLEQPFRRLVFKQGIFGFFYPFRLLFLLRCQCSFLKHFF